jgi:hypothetical protein
MENCFEDIHKNMLAELANTERMEDKFHVAMEYWLAVKEIFKSRPYDHDGEMEFFRNIKPLFTSYIEYYLLLNKSLAFLPEDAEGAIAFWEEETKQLQRYCEKHADFIRYYESYSSEFDSDYFTRGNNRQTAPPQGRIYEDGDCRSSHDHIVRGLLARRMYNEYVLERLEELVK